MLNHSRRIAKIWETREFVFGLWSLISCFIGAVVQLMLSCKSIFLMITDEDPGEYYESSIADTLENTDGDDCVLNLEEVQEIF